MKVVILAGGFGTRLSEETELRPKPMVEIGGKPIIWHIMKHYACYGHKEFVVALGYKAEIVKDFFINYSAINNSLTVDLATGDVKRHGNIAEDWIIHLIDTGADTNTGGRLKRLKPWVDGETFMMTYGDGVSDVNLDELLELHNKHGLVGTVTAVRPPARFGGITFENDIALKFSEKSQISEGWINGGFFVFSPRIFDYLQNDDTSLEINALESVAADRQLAIYKHENFWQCMDTLRDKHLLEKLWQSGNIKWKL